MRRLLAVAASLAVVALALAACGGSDPATPVHVAPAAPLPGAKGDPPAAAAAEALSRIADGATARRRLGYVDLGRLTEVGGATVLRSVLGPAGAAAAGSAATGTAVQVGPATVLGGGRVVGGSAALRAALANPAPARNAIRNEAASAVLSCVGDAPAMTIVGEEAMGHDAAIGAGLRRSAEAPAGLQLVVCGAPHFRRHLFSMERRLERRYGDAGKPAIAVTELGEREIVSAVIPATEVPRDELRALLAGSVRLRTLLGD